MPHTNFLSLGKSLIRNIVNSNQIDNELSNFITSKNLDSFPNIKKWVKTVVRNYILQKLEIKTIVDKDRLPSEILEVVNKKNIQPPYHIVELPPSFIESISHTVDYLKSSFEISKDLSRISWSQSQINAKVWLEERLRNLSTQEDFENVVTIKEFSKDGDDYRWVNIRSHKALQRESKLMSHCIETYWELDYPKEVLVQKESPYYSLRDKNNKSIVTLFREFKNENIQNEVTGLYDFFIGEIKEKGNAPLSNKNRDLVDILLEGKKIGIHNNEQTNSQYYHTNDSTVPNSKKVGPIKSINYIIKHGLKFYCLKPLNIENFENDFSKESLYSIGPWKKLEITGKDNFTFLSAIEIEASNIFNRGVIFITSKLFFKNADNVQIALISNKHGDSDDNVRIFENISNAKITLLVPELTDTYYIFKNCHNIEVASKNLNKLDNSKIQLNVIKIDSTDINIELLKLSYSKNELELNANNQYSFSIKDDDTFLVGNQNNQQCSNMALRNKFFTKVINKFLTLNLKNYEDNRIVYNFVSQLHIEIINTFSNDITLFNINDKSMRHNTEFILNNFLRNTDATVEKIYDGMDLDTFKNYKNFVIKNAYDILKNDLLDKFPSSENIISAMSQHFQSMIIESRPLLIKTLIGQEDNFSKYVSTIFFTENKMLEDMSANKLLIYMLKNELVNEANNNYHPDNMTNYRFAFTENRLTKSNCSRWFDFLSPKLFDESHKKEIVELFIESYDNNILLAKLIQLPNLKKDKPLLTNKM